MNLVGKSCAEYDWWQDDVEQRMSLYRITIRTEDKGRFFELLSGIRPDDNKIQRIEPHSDIHRIDVVINDEELAFLKLAMPKLAECWLEMWEDNDRH